MYVYIFVIKRLRRLRERQRCTAVVQARDIRQSMRDWAKPN